MTLGQEKAIEQYWSQYGIEPSETEFNFTEIFGRTAPVVLEIGFGMGISASYIQAIEPRSHTIVECHPQVLERLCVWARDKPTVTIVEGEWFQRRHDLGRYDGVLYDIYDDPNEGAFYKDFERLLKPGARMTFYNLVPRPENEHGVPDCEYFEVDVQPDPNDYYHASKYYVPLFTAHVHQGLSDQTT